MMEDYIMNFSSSIFKKAFNLAKTVITGARTAVQQIRFYEVKKVQDIIELSVLSFLCGRMPVGFTNAPSA